MDSALGSVVIIVLCLALSAFASAAETGLTGVRRSRILQLAEEEHNRQARTVAGLLLTPQRFLTTILVINSVAIVVASALATELAQRFLAQSPAWARDVVTTVCMSLVVLILAEITPKILAIGNTERTALGLGPVVNFFAFLLTPVIAVLTWVTSWLARLVGSPTTRLDQHYTEEELRHLVEVSEQQGVLEEEETAMIHGVFDFGETLVREVMQPRIDVIALDVEAPLDEAIDVILNAGHSRIPAYEDTIDHIVGILYVRDLLPYLLPERRSIDFTAIVREPLFVAESEKVAQVFHKMKSKKMHLAIVSDEYTGTAGIVTIEDLLEEIVGEIQDEFDTEDAAVSQVEDGVFMVDGGVTISTINELLDLELESDAYDTVGGLIYSQLGAAPGEGAMAVVDGLQATVVELDGRRIRRARVERREAAAPGAEGALPV